MRNRKGMTLVEVIVAMALFAIVMVTLFTAFLITNVMNNVSKEFSDASYLAQNEIERIYGLSQENTVNQVITDLHSNHGYACVLVVDVDVCEKTVDDFKYQVSFKENLSVVNITIVTIVVEAITGDYAGDRVQIENHLRFRVGG
jgi:prepilin-type N-terminal cleavage/methylation domain-containing protein